jgi:hypothetical protein
MWDTAGIFKELQLSKIQLVYSQLDDKYKRLKYAALDITVNAG